MTPRSVLFHVFQERCGLHPVGGEGGCLHANGGGPVLPEVPVHRHHGQGTAGEERRGGENSEEATSLALPYTALPLTQAAFLFVRPTTPTNKPYEHGGRSFFVLADSQQRRGSVCVLACALNLAWLCLKLRCPLHRLLPVVFFAGAKKGRRQTEPTVACVLPSEDGSPTLLPRVVRCHQRGVLCRTRGSWADAVLCVGVRLMP